MPAPSKVGTIDPADTKSRVYVDAELNEVDPGSEDAAFVFKRGALDSVKARREELGLATGDEAARAQRDSRRNSLPALRRAAAEAADRLAAAEAAVSADEAAVKEDNKASAKASAKASE